MRRFVIVGETASASGDFSLLDVPSTSGRLDVLLRCVRAALLFSHGLRRDTRVYLVLRGSPKGPRVLRLSGDTIRFLRPDERSLAILVQKALQAPGGAAALAFEEVRPGIAVCSGGLEKVFEELAGVALYVLEEGATDLRAEPPAAGECCFVVGDHLGLAPGIRAELAARGARFVAVGPVSLHSDDAVALVVNELDRREIPGA